MQKADLNWTETGEEVAIKEVSWEAIRASRGRISEDFVKEVAALQHVAEWHENEMNGRSILETHVISANVIMTDESNLYIVMPYCAGGDLCQQVGFAEDYRLTEDESRHWFKQILKVIIVIKSALWSTSSSYTPPWYNVPARLGFGDTSGFVRGAII